MVLIENTGDVPQVDWFVIVEFPHHRFVRQAWMVGLSGQAFQSIELKYFLLDQLVDQTGHYVVPVQQDMLHQ